MAGLDRGTLTAADLNIDPWTISGLTIVDQGDWLLGANVAGVEYTAPASNVYEYLPNAFRGTSTDIGAPPTSLAGSSSSWIGSQQGVATMGAISAVASALNSAVSGYYASNIQKIQMRMQQQVAEFNQRQAERSAQAALMQSNARIGQLSRQYESVKNKQKVSMAANGIVLGQGSAAEVTATTDIDKRISINNQYLNGYREAWGYRMQGVSQGLQASAAQSYGTSSWASLVDQGATGVVKIADFLYRNNQNKGVV